VVTRPLPAAAALLLAACGGNVLLDPGGQGGAPTTSAASSTGEPVTTITFQLFGTAGEACEGDGASWLQISSVTPTGLVPIGNEEPYSPIDCGACAQTMPYPIGAACQLLTPMGASTTWDGTVWQQGTCGPGATTCYSVVKAPPGKYVANMCASFENSTMTSCTAVPFEYPGPSPVVGKVP
jgi:hypothetical protein